MENRQSDGVLFPVIEEVDYDLPTNVVMKPMVFIHGFLSMS